MAQEICSDCDGAGKIEGTCSYCSGAGKRGTALHDFDRDEEDDCSHCGGTGSMNAKCRSCGGSGYIFFHTREEDDISHIDTHEEDSESLDNNEEEDGEEEGGEDEIIISAKGVMDGAITLDEAIEKFNEYINYLEELRNEGYELCDPIEGDQGFLQKM